MARPIRVNREETNFDRQIREWQSNRVIQCYPEELDYVNAKLHGCAHVKPGRFLRLFLNACLSADAFNYRLLRPALLEFMKKYPADHERLRMERIDRGADDDVMAT